MPEIGLLPFARVALQVATRVLPLYRNHQHIRQRWRAQSIIPLNPRRGVPQGTLRRQMYLAFPQKQYGQRAKVETIFSVVKRKLSSCAPGRSLPG